MDILIAVLTVQVRVIMVMEEVMGAEEVRMVTEAEEVMVARRLLNHKHQAVEDDVVDGEAKMEFHCSCETYLLTLPLRILNKRFDELGTCVMCTSQQTFILVNPKVLHLWNMPLRNKQVRQRLK